MKRIIYTSTARSPITADREDVLRRARTRNAAAGVTGLLVVGGRRFLQALEGPEEAVADIYERIRCDPRHFAIVTLVEQRVADRAFSDWAMGYQDGGSDADAGDLTTIVERLIAPITDPSIQGYFRGFADRHAIIGAR